MELGKKDGEEREEAHRAEPVRFGDLERLVRLLVLALVVGRLGNEVAERLGQAERELAARRRLELVGRRDGAVQVARRRDAQVRREEDDELTCARKTESGTVT